MGNTCKGNMTPLNLLMKKGKSISNLHAFCRVPSETQGIPVIQVTSLKRICSSVKSQVVLQTFEGKKRKKALYELDWKTAET